MFTIEKENRVLGTRQVYKTVYQIEGEARIQAEYMARGCQPFIFIIVVNKKGVTVATYQGTPKK